MINIFKNNMYLKSSFNYPLIIIKYIINIFKNNIYLKSFSYIIF